MHVDLALSINQYRCVTYGAALIAILKSTPIRRESWNYAYKAGTDVKTPELLCTTRLVPQKCRQVATGHHSEIIGGLYIPKLLPTICRSGAYFRT